MLIYGKNLKLYFWQCTRSSSGYCELPEIEKEEYGYNLEPGQTIYNMRLDKHKLNLSTFWDCKIIEVNNDDVRFSSSIPACISQFIPWEVEGCDLMIIPCENLYEKNRLKDILAGNIDDVTIKNNKVLTHYGEGIWYKHGGWRTKSSYEENLKNFTKLGQMQIV